MHPKLLQIKKNLKLRQLGLEESSTITSAQALDMGIQSEATAKSMSIYDSSRLHFLEKAVWAQELAALLEEEELGHSSVE